MQRTSRRLQFFLTAAEIDRVVAVAGIGRAAVRAHKATVPELSQVVRHQVLWLVDQIGEFPNRAVALDQCFEETPAQGMGGEGEESRRPSRRHAGNLPAAHAIHQIGLMQFVLSDIPIDGRGPYVRRVGWRGKNEPS